MDWEQRALRLADQVTDPVSRWRLPIASTPRHELVPRWWERHDGDTWILRDGPSDIEPWMRTAYQDKSVITRVGALHADHGEPGDLTEGRPTSSATHPGLVVRMLRHGRLADGMDVLDVGTGAGGLTACASWRLGDRHVTSVDIDPYLCDAARGRLAAMGLHPQIHALDATADRLPGTYDRIIATVAVRPVPASWLAALRPGGRLVTTIANTSLILTAWKGEDGGAVGQFERDWAAFMTSRRGADYKPGLDRLFAVARDVDGDKVSTGRYPVVDVENAWELRSMLEIVVPGVELGYELNGRKRAAYLVHADGSWARAIAERLEPPTVHQGGPRQLWDELERIRNRQAAEGGLSLYGSRVRITPDGVIHLSRGRWTATIA
ncbi:methyltransferase domain-containing protein [Streptomyces sp. NBC_00872]|uniref:methyltransferase domain-containing protein n=1 Tax=Streptomyces sp. NBC_00872 TaxID=2903686 RepID=UPI003865E87E|nr:methyltransferase domain-containing protein [Streptomyces sp. NBC_00872]